MIQDIRYALRMLVRNPGFALVAVLALALGIGPNSAIFSIVSAVLLRPLPVKDADRVVSVWETNARIGLPQIPASEANYLDWKQQNQAFEQMATAFALPEYGLNVVAGREPERVPAGKASAAFFDVLGVRPVFGRAFLPEEDRAGGPGAALVSYGFWQRMLNSDQAVVGRRITVDGVPRTVVGVLPADLQMFGRIDVWIPVAMDPNSTQRSNRSWGVFARLKPGVTVQQAQAEMNGIAGRLARQYPEADEGWGVAVVPLHKLVGGFLAPPLMFLLGAVGLLLLLACANVANLLLAKAAGRQKEIAVRVALGAGRLRVVRQLLTESVVIALAGGAFGLLLAKWSIGLLRGLIPDVFPLMQQVSIDNRVLLFTFVVALVTGLIFGAAPAIRISKADLNSTLKATGRAVTGGGVQKLRDGLVTVEIALALVLVVAAGLMARSFARLMSVNPGLRTNDVLTMQLTLPTARYRGGEARAVLPELGGAGGGAARRRIGRRHPVPALPRELPEQPHLGVAFPCPGRAAGARGPGTAGRFPGGNAALLHGARHPASPRAVLRRARPAQRSRGNHHQRSDGQAASAGRESGRQAAVASALGSAAARNRWRGWGCEAVFAGLGRGARCVCATLPAAGRGDEPGGAQPSGPASAH